MHVSNVDTVFLELVVHSVLQNVWYHCALHENLVSCSIPIEFPMILRENLSHILGTTAYIIAEFPVEIKPNFFPTSIEVSNRF